MIIVTGAAGFIGSALIEKLNSEGFKSVVAVDDFSSEQKNQNLAGKDITHRIHRTDFLNWLPENEREIEFIFHLGARTDTAEFDMDLLHQLNTNYSMEVWKRCCKYQIPLVYASSAATYGLGELGYSDDEDSIPQLKPLNPYGLSKQEFDQWALEAEEKPFYWTGLKFFNVYGPNEYHKGRMASVVYHAFNQIRTNGKMSLFRSHHPDFSDGEQMRDFIYVKDVVDVCYWLMHHRKNSGIYNLGSGKARTFNVLVNAVFDALELPADIEYIDTPEDIREKYQYFTEASMNKLKSIGYRGQFTTLEKGVTDYVRNYLKAGSFL